MSIDLISLADRKQHYASRKIGSEYVIVPIKSNVAEMNVLITLNEVGSFIWDQLAPNTTLEEIELSIVTEFDVPKERAQHDLSHFLTRLDSALKY